MNRRLIIIIGSSLAVILLLSPFIYHKFKFDSQYRSNRSLWYRVSMGNYDAIVLSNSLDYPTGGENTIRVRKGQLLQGINPSCATCTPVDYLPLTIEALFDRIYEECIRGKLLPICHIVYDETLGYPARIDTYTFYENGIHAPSITLTEVHIIESD